MIGQWWQTANLRLNRLSAVSPSHDVHPTSRQRRLCEPLARTAINRLFCVVAGEASWQIVDRRSRSWWATAVADWRQRRRLVAACWSSRWSPMRLTTPEHTTCRTRTLVSADNADCALSSVVDSNRSRSRYVWSQIFNIIVISVQCANVGVHRRVTV